MEELNPAHVHTSEKAEAERQKSLLVPFIFPRFQRNSTSNLTCTLMCKPRNFRLTGSCVYFHRVIFVWSIHLEKMRWKLIIVNGVHLITILHSFSQMRKVPFGSEKTHAGGEQTSGVWIPMTKHSCNDRYCYGEYRVEVDFSYIKV